MGTCQENEKIVGSTHQHIQSAVQGFQRQSVLRSQYRFCNDFDEQQYFLLRCDYDLYRGQWEDWVGVPHCCKWTNKKNPFCLPVNSSNTIARTLYSCDLWLSLNLSFCSISGSNSTTPFPSIRTVLITTLPPPYTGVIETIALPLTNLPNVYLERTISRSFSSLIEKWLGESMVVSNLGKTYSSIWKVFDFFCDWKLYQKNQDDWKSERECRFTSSSPFISTWIDHSPSSGCSISFNWLEKTPLVVRTNFHCLTRLSLAS